MSQIKDDMVPYMTQDEIREITISLAREIETDYRGSELVLVGPLKGSVLFLADLVRHLTLPLQVDFVSVATDRGGALRVIKDINTNIRGRHVLIVEEIIDSGRKLSALKSYLQSSHPASIKVVTLLDKPARRELPVVADYIGRTIDDRYVVGYGMDNEELGRNYPDIYYLKH